MKINIGPFISRWTTTDLEDWWLTKRSGATRWEEARDEYQEDKFDEIFEWLCDQWQTVLNFTINKYLDNKKRKIKIHIDGYDVWSLDHTLSMIVLPMLKKLHENKHGAPNTDDKDVPKRLRSTTAPPKDNEWDTDGNHFKRWEWIMNEMIWTFTQLTDEENDMKFYKGSVLDRKGYEKHSKRISKGLMLFGKYYRGLWD